MTPEEPAVIVDRWANIWISEVVDGEENSTPASATPPHHSN